MSDDVFFVRFDASGHLTSCGLMRRDHVQDEIDAGQRTLIANFYVADLSAWRVVAGALVAA